MTYAAARNETSYTGYQHDNGIVQGLHQDNIPSGIACKWELLRAQILIQWTRLSSSELDSIGPNRSRLASLIGSRYDVSASLVDNYLRNFERTLPIS